MPGLSYLCVAAVWVKTTADASSRRGLALETDGSILSPRPGPDSALSPDNTVIQIPTHTERVTGPDNPDMRHREGKK